MLCSVMVPPASGITNARSAARNPLINPPADVLARVKQWPPLTDEQVKEYTTEYAAVTGS